MELAKKRLETAILRVEALINAVPKASTPTSDKSIAPLSAENEALRKQIEAVHQENVALRQSLEAMGSRLDQIIERLDEVVTGSESAADKQE